MAESIEHRMTEIYCFVDDYLGAYPALSGWRRSPHSTPRFSDSKVVTVALARGHLRQLLGTQVRAGRRWEGTAESIRSSLTTPEVHERKPGEVKVRFERHRRPARQRAQRRDGVRLQGVGERCRD